MHSDNELIKGIQNNEDWAISELYKTQFTTIKKMVYTFRNTILEPEDIFQEGLTRVLLNVRAGKFKGESSLATYLNSICRNICLKLLSKHKTVNLENEMVPFESVEDNHYELLAFISELKKQMGDNCRDIIDLRFKQTEENNTENKLPSFDEIAERLNISAANARQRFKRCFDQLRDMVYSHPEYQTLFD